MLVYRRYLWHAARLYGLGTLAAVSLGALLFAVSLRLTPAGWTVFILSVLGGVVPMVLLDVAITLSYLRPLRRFIAAGAAGDPGPEAGGRAYACVRALPEVSALRTIGPHFLGLTIPGVAVGLLLSRQYATGATPIQVVLVTAAAFSIACGHGVFEYLAQHRAIVPLLVSLRPYADGAPRARRLSVRSRSFIISCAIGAIPTAAMAMTAYTRFAGGPGFRMADYVRWVVALSAFGAIFSVVAALLLARSVTDPLESLLVAVRALADGAPVPQLSEDAADEFGEVMHGFNQMAAALDHRLGEQAQLTDSIIAVLAAALDARDPYTQGHSERVAQVAMRIGERLGLCADDRLALERAARLHDIGKIGVKGGLLLKRGPLTDDEWSEMRRHPVIGSDILSRVRPESAVASLLPAVRSHHERPDGRGYPEGLRSPSIPLLARIIAVADAYDALTSDRPYRPRLSPQQARTILADGAGTQWDSTIVGAFLCLG